jgi:antiviral helicase SKI2
LPVRYKKNDTGSILNNAAGQEYIICSITAKDTLGVSTHTINNVDVSGILVDSHINKIAPVIQQLVRIRDKYPQPLTADTPIPMLDVYDDMNVRDLDIVDGAYRMKELKVIIESHICHACIDKATNLHIMDKRAAVMNRLQYLRTLLSDQNLILIEEFGSRLRVLEKLQYINDQRIVQLKGRIACEINTCESLIIVEMLMHNAFADLTPHEIVALLSCLICQEKNMDEELSALPERLQGSVDELYNTATALAHLQLTCGLDINTEEWVKSNVNPALCYVVYEWSMGMPFSEVCQLTSVAEGSIVRCITRLDETCRDLRNAAKTIGDLSLYERMQKASESIKRDIVFAASLYVT